MGGTADKRTRVCGEGDKIASREAQKSRKVLIRRETIFGRSVDGGGFVPAPVHRQGRSPFFPALD
jgi:hypothetical protein